MFANSTRPGLLTKHGYRGLLRKGAASSLSADRRILSRPHQIKAIYDSKLIAVILARGWTNLKRHVQAAHVIYHWPEIEKLLEGSKPLDCWKVLPVIGESKIKPVKVNYEQAIKAAGR